MLHLSPSRSWQLRDSMTCVLHAAGNGLSRVAEPPAATAWRRSGRPAAWAALSPGSAFTLQM